MTEDKELLPCLCGQPAGIMKAHGEYFTACSDPGCPFTETYDTEEEAREQWNKLHTRPARPEAALQALDKARTIIVNEAAALARCDGLPSNWAGDHDKKVPAWILRLFTDIHNQSRTKSVRLKQAYDILGTTRTALSQSRVVPGTGNSCTTPLICRTEDEDGNKVVILAEWYHDSIMKTIDRLSTDGWREIDAGQVHNAFWEAYKTLPEQIRKRFSMHIGRKFADELHKQIKEQGNGEKS